MIARAVAAGAGGGAVEGEGEGVAGADGFGVPADARDLGDRAVVHLVGKTAPPDPGDDLGLEHFAFRAQGMDRFTRLLTERGIAHSIDPVPGIPVTQINLHDPDGNHIHIDFDTSAETP